MSNGKGPRRVLSWVRGIFFFRESDYYENNQPRAELREGFGFSDGELRQTKKAFLIYKAELVGEMEGGPGTSYGSFWECSRVGWRHWGLGGLSLLFPLVLRCGNLKFF